jgi:hypothetical protein
MTYTVCVCAMYNPTREQSLYFWPLLLAFTVIILRLTCCFCCFSLLQQRMNLNTMTLMIESPMVYTKQGVAVCVTGIAQVSFSSWSFVVSCDWINNK